VTKVELINVGFPHNISVMRLQCTVVLVLFTSGKDLLFNT